MERAFYLPPGSSARVRPRAFGKLVLSVAELPPPGMRELLRRLGRGAPRDRAGLPRRARTLAAAARRFLDPGDRLHQRALDALPMLTGFSPEMVEAALPRVFEAIGEAPLVEIASRCAAPVARVVGIVSAGNLPGVAVPKAALALTAGSSCVVKTAADEPLLMALFAEALAEEAADVASALAVLWWPGGAALCEGEFFRGIDSLIAYGSDDAIDAIGALAAAAPATFVGHGHKLSVAVVRLGGVVQARSLAFDAALDIALYDQLGCLSPQCIFTVGGDLAERGRFLDALSAALADLDRRLPPGELPEASALRVHRFRDEYEWRAIGGEDVSVRGVSGRWAVIDDPTAGFRPSPLHRTIVVRRLEALAELPRALGGWLPRVESVGIGPWPAPEAAVELEALGIPRIVSLGRMQSPDLGWRQGGTDPMAGINLEKKV
jgi:Acyl-CoA reductase (LuxC)